MGALLQCSTIHFKIDVSSFRTFNRTFLKPKLGTFSYPHLLIFLYQGLLMDCNNMNAAYLFMQDKLYDVKYDTGDKVIQCGRHNDIFKLWLQWRAKVPKSQKPYFLIKHLIGR